MWEPFNLEARNSIVLAQQEAQKMNSSFIGSEHLLLGLLANQEAQAARVLERFNVTLERVRAEVGDMRGASRSAVKREMIFSPAAKQVIESSFDEARKLGHHYIGTEHMLLGLLRRDGSASDNVITRIFNALEVDIEAVRSEMLNSLNVNEPKKAPRKPKAKTSLLDKYGRDLTQMAMDGKLDPVIGRLDEINRVIMVLSRRTKSNPALVGDPGVGKTAIVEGLAQLIAKGEVPEKLKDKRIYSVDLAGIVAGTRYRGEFEDRMKKIMDEIRNAKGEIIVFIDELHVIIGAGSAEGSLDAANILKPALSRGEFQCIGATTLAEYTKYIEKDPALERRFQPIDVQEPSVEDATKILFGLRDRFESYHGVRITDEALREAVRLSSRYINDRFLPDKAIDVLDEASSRTSLKISEQPSELNAAQDKVRELNIGKEEALAAQDYEQAAELREQEEVAVKVLENLKEEWHAAQKHSGDKRLVVDSEDVAFVVSVTTGVPLSRLAESEAQKLLHIEDHLHKRVIGQEEPVRVVSRAIKRARAGLKDPSKPIGSFLFLGPTGVGKTELARTLADYLFDDESAMIRLDMSEYMEKFTVSRLSGPPPGYVGYEEGGQLSDAVRRKPYSVVLFDEIEKAHPDVFNVLLHIMDEGRMTDSKKREIDFKNVVIVLTSNIGFSEPDSSAGLGLRGNREEGSSEVRYERMKKKVMEETKKVFKPEFLNRLDASVVFHSLEPEHLLKIVDIMLDKVSHELGNNKRSLQVTESAKQALVASCNEPQYGARPLRRAIQNMLEDPLADEFLTGKFPEGSVIIVDAEEIADASSVNADDRAVGKDKDGKMMRLVFRRAEEE